MKFIFSIITLCIIMTSYAQESKELEEVIILANRTTSTVDGYTTNLRGADISKGKQASEVLTFLPNISYREGRFLINGLPVSGIYVDGLKLANISELSNIPGVSIDKVQVKYLAGSNQRASLSGGTIMITLRRPPEGGYYGNIKANASWVRSCGFGNAGAGAMAVYRHKGLSVYDNLSLGASKVEEHSKLWRTGPDLNTFITEKSNMSGLNIYNRLSISQEFGSGARLGGCYMISASNPKNSSVSNVGSTVSTIDEHYNVTTQEGTVQFSMPMNKKGAFMELTADYLNWRNNEDADYMTGAGNNLSTRERTNLNLWKLQADFQYTIGERLSLAFGGSAHWISSTFNPLSFDNSRRFEITTLPSRTSGFTPVAYATVQGLLWKLRYSIGLNWQMNRIRFEDLEAAVRNSNTQWALSPVIQLMLPFHKEKNAMSLSYKRTLEDIPYTAISPTIQWNDAYNYTVGNPNIKAQSSDILMAMLSLMNNQVNLMALFGRTHNEIVWQTFQSTSDPDVFYTSPVNISGTNTWAFGAEWGTSPFKWWRFKISGQLMVSPENTTLGNVHYGKTRLKEYFFFNNSFIFKNGWGGMLNMNLEPTYRSLDRTYHAVYNVDGRVYKTFLNNRLQIFLDFRPFGNRRRLDRQAGKNTVSYKYVTPVQYARISLLWYFSGGKRVEGNIVDGIQEYKDSREKR